MSGSRRERKLPVRSSRRHMRSRTTFRSFPRRGEPRQFRYFEHEVIVTPIRHATEHWRRLDRQDTSLDRTTSQLQSALGLTNPQHDSPIIFNRHLLHLLHKRIVPSKKIIITLLNTFSVPSRLERTLNIHQHRHVLSTPRDPA